MGFSFSPPYPAPPSPALPQSPISNSRSLLLGFSPVDNKGQQGIARPQLGSSSRSPLRILPLGRRLQLPTQKLKRPRADTCSKGQWILTVIHRYHSAARRLTNNDYPVHLHQRDSWTEERGSENRSEYDADPTGVYLESTTHSHGWEEESKCALGTTELSLSLGFRIK